MIYAKIFLKNDPNNQKDPCVVIESVNQNIPDHCALANSTRMTLTAVSPVEEVVISPEAQETLLSLLSYKNRNIGYNIVDPDFNFYQDTIEFKPTNGNNIKVLDLKSKILLNPHRSSYSIIKKMPTLSNEAVEKLDLSAPVDIKDLTSSQPNFQ